MAKDREFKRLRSSNALKWFPDRRGLAAGLTVPLGSDSAMSSNYLDAIRQAFLIVGGLHEARLDPKVLRPETAVEMLTINGARCMHWDKDLGSIEVGKKADVTLLDIRRPEWQPVHNPI